METNHGILYINFNRDKLLIIPFYQILLFFSSEETVDRKQGSVKSDRFRKVSSSLVWGIESRVSRGLLASSCKKNESLITSAS